MSSRPLLGLLAFSSVTSGCLFVPCSWDHQPSRCTLERVDVRPASDSVMTKDVVWTEARYRVVGPHGTATLMAALYHRLPQGASREAAAAAGRAYFERHADLSCSWGRITSGACAPNEFRMPLPGCTDQRMLTCYELSPSELHP